MQCWTLSDMVRGGKHALGPSKLKSSAIGDPKSIRVLHQELEFWNLWYLFCRYPDYALLLQQNISIGIKPIQCIAMHCNVELWWAIKNKRWNHWSLEKEKNVNSGCNSSNLTARSQKKTYLHGVCIFCHHHWIYHPNFCNVPVCANCCSFLCSIILEVK